MTYTNVTPAAAGKCRGHYPDLVAEFSTGLRIWGGAASAVDNDLINELPIKLVFDITDTRGRKYKCQPSIHADDSATALLGPDITLSEVYDDPAVVYIDWADYDRGPISLDKEWWQCLGDKLATITGDIAICCVGGHGRTGTFLSILLTFLPKHLREEIDLQDGDCPVTFMRSLYCDDAVEDKRQLAYIEEMTGRVVVAKLNNHFTMGYANAAGPAKAPPSPPAGNPTYIKKVEDGTAKAQGWDYVPDPYDAEDDGWFK
jgi:hypothetical protein